VEEGIAQDNHPDDEPPAPIDSEELKRRIAQINQESHSKEEKKAIKTLEDKYLPKLQEYEKHLDTLGKRNSYSKTDPNATFMRMKEDHMLNGQLKPAYNVQIGTENQFFTHYDFFPNPTDTLTYIPFMNGFEQRYNRLPKKAVADSGYGSEENYEFMEINDIEPFVKYNYFHKEQKRSFKNNGFHAQNLFYNAKEDYFVCPMGQHMEKTGTTKRKSDNGYISEISVYQAKNCHNCPLKCLCNNAKENRRIEVNHNLNRHKQKARELLNSQEGLLHRSRRPIEPEAVFGQTKANKHYNRFRHFDKDKVMMDFAIFAIAFNIGKLYRKAIINNKLFTKTRKQADFCGFILLFIPKTENVIEFSTIHSMYPKIAA
jgi:Transposase DDE domain